MRYDLCVIGGGGHVGLPLSLAFADKGLNVCIYDINESVLRSIEDGVMPFHEEGAEELLKRNVGSRLFVSSAISSISDSDCVITVIGTPIDEYLNPQFNLMKKFLDGIAGQFRDGQTFILRSTLYPGTTERVRDYFKRKGLRMGVAFCPERISEGQALREFKELPQIVSAFDADTLEEVKKLFGLLSEDILVLEPIEAEMAKLFTNSWRYIQFSIANQFYMTAENFGIDFYRIFDAMTYKYPRCANLPKPGFSAGPCLLKDTMQLAAFNNNNFILGHSAMLVNEGLPNYIVGRLKSRYTLSEMAVGVLGMAFKPESDDPRDSLSYKLRKILDFECGKVLCSDAYIKDPAFVSEEALIEGADIIILAIPHRKYAGLDFRGKPVVDIWNFLGQGGNIV
jgi:UDP-N-acetyl-D-mannosaminuronic acid dehydrogenase